MEDAISVILPHLGVDVVAGVAQLGDLLGEQLYSLHWVAEDYGLVDLKLRKQKNNAQLMHLVIHVSDWNGFAMYPKVS